MQKIMLVGNLGGDAEQKQVGDQAVVEFSIAVTSKVKGEKETQWYRCSYWGRAATAVQQYLTKGRRVAVSGDFRARTYEGQKGAGLSLDVRVDSLSLCGGGDRASGNGGGGGGAGRAPADDSDLPF